MAGIDPFPLTDVEARLLRRIKELEDRMEQLERYHPRASVTNVVPSGAAPDGTVVLFDDGATCRVYFRVLGVWRFASLT